MRRWMLVMWGTLCLAACAVEEDELPDEEVQALEKAVEPEPVDGWFGGFGDVFNDPSEWWQGGRQDMFSGAWVEDDEGGFAGWGKSWIGRELTSFLMVGDLRCHLDVGIRVTGGTGGFMAKLRVKVVRGGTNKVVLNERFVFGPTAKNEDLVLEVSSNDWIYAVTRVVNNAKLGDVVVYLIAEKPDDLDHPNAFRVTSLINVCSKL
jgi:hypothetical protein